MRHEQPRRLAIGHSAFRLPPSAFTLVELLVVIAIIGVLAALLVTAVGPAINRGNQARITAEITQIDTAIKDYKNAVGSFPPNAQIDDPQPLNQPEVAATPIVEATVKSEFERHLLKAAPNHREPPELIQALIGLSPTAAGSNVTQAGRASNLPGGMTAAEALVFWIGGFSDDPEYPISGSGGPSYKVDTNLPPNQQDPIENRSWRLGIKIENLAPRGEDKYFDATSPRFITYTDPRDTSANPARRRINFWVLNAPGRETPYLYFDASRGGGAAAANDVPAATALAVDSVGYEQLTTVHAVKTLNNDASARLPFVFANNTTFQVLHPGTDDEWAPMPVVNPTPPNTVVRTDTAFQNWLLKSGTSDPDLRYFPDGPWVEELADTLTNFTESTLEDAQP